MSGHSPGFDLVLWGATGFVGRLIAEYLLDRHGAAGDLRWALGGRSRTKLETLRAELGPEAEVLPLVTADADDESSLRALAERTSVVCTTVGPYSRYGSRLVAACVGTGTDYCDLTGEVPWMRRMIDAHQPDAVTSGARIVHACGFDSIPSDLGVFHLQHQMRKHHGVACRRIRFRVARIRGGISGGTAASMLHILEEGARDRAVRRILVDPYALNPAGQRGPDRTERFGPAWDGVFGQWTGPFVMAGVNTRVVRRTNALLAGAYGPEFRYDEAVLLGRGAAGWLRASSLSVTLGATVAAGTLGPPRKLLARALPSPGEGPTPEQQRTGFFDIRLHGEHPEDPDKALRSRVTGDRDPGYGSTAKMLGEAAVCLAKDDLDVEGGFWTPASAMGEPLLKRLREHAGLTFALQAESADSSG